MNSSSRRVKEALQAKRSAAEFNALLFKLLGEFKHNARYKYDQRLHRIWLIYLESSDDRDSVSSELENCQICSGNAILYEQFASWLESKEAWKRAHYIYRLGIERKAKPLRLLEDAFNLFRERVSDKINKIHQNNEEEILGGNYVNPWSSSTVDELIKKISSQLVKYEGYHQSTKPLVEESLLALQKASRSRFIKIGGNKYQIKGCAGKGSFGQVLKARIESNPDRIVALKTQIPPFPWEFYMYRQLDARIPEDKRRWFGNAHSIHVYSNTSILECGFYSNGTLQDVINSYVVVGKAMEEVLCMYYTAEMLHMLETLHRVGIIHGDFKPDNILIRHSKDKLDEEGYSKRLGSWGEEGLCLVDWGRGIDLRLFGSDVVFKGDCRTSGFRCVEMQEGKAWKYQADAYGLCVIVHMMLHNTYMNVRKNRAAGGGYVYKPAAPMKRYWNVDMWKKLFTEMLNNRGLDDDADVLRRLRHEMDEYVCSNPKLLSQLKHLLLKNRHTFCSA